MYISDDTESFAWVLIIVSNWIHNINALILYLPFKHKQKSFSFTYVYICNVVYVYDIFNLTHVHAHGSYSWVNEEWELEK